MAAPTSMRASLQVTSLSCLLVLLALPVAADGDPNVHGNRDKDVDEDSIQVVANALAARHAEETGKRVEVAENLWLFLSDLEDDEDWADYLSSTIGAVTDWLADEKEPWVRYYLLRALADLEDESVRDEVLGHLEDRDPALRAVAADCAGYILSDLEDEEAEDLEKRLLHAYSDRDPWWVRTAILEALGDGAGDASLERLQRSLADRSRDVRAAASVALRSRQDPRSVQALAEAFETAGLAGTDSPVAALAAIGGPAALEVLERALGSPYPLVRAEAARGIGASDRREHVPALAPLLQDRDSVARSAAAGAMVRLGGDEAAWQLLIAAARTGDASLARWVGRMDGSDLDKACSGIENRRGLDRETREAASQHCVRARTSGSHGSHLARGCVMDVSELTGAESSYDAALREVAPESAEAVAWDRAVGEENGGEKVQLPRGRRVQVIGGFEHRGETWLAVNSERDPFHQIWLRERDLRPFDPDRFVKGGVPPEPDAGAAGEADEGSGP